MARLGIRRRALSICTLPAILSLLAVTAAAPAEDAARDTLYLAAPFVALADGLYDGEVTFAALKEHGDLGLGAIAGSDGELVLLDGRCHQVKGDGSVAILPDSLTTPWAMATFFDREWETEVSGPVDMAALLKALDAKVADPGLPHAFRIDGRFAQIRTRSVGGQKPPYRRLIEVIRDQVTFDLADAEGTIVGFRIPGYLEGLNVPGYHMHFLTADRRAGGHVLAFRADGLRAAADVCRAVHVELPRDRRFSAKDSKGVDRKEMDQILGRVPLGEAPRPD
jgi:acetolactate decarboxylase